MKKPVQILFLSGFLLTLVLLNIKGMTNLQKQVWKDVIGYEGLYKVSSDGQIINRKGKIKSQNLRKEYYSVILYNSFHEWKNHTVHRLVAIHFLDNPENLSQVNHKDGNKLNNSYSNLEWCTPKQNTDHAINHGLRRPAVGQKYKRSSLTDYDVRVIRKMSETLTHKEISELFGIGQPSITRIINRQNWKHVI